MRNFASFNINGIDSSINASGVSMSSISGLDSKNVQDCIEELNDNDTVVTNDISIIKRSIPLSGFYHRRYSDNIVLHPSNFSKFGYYSSTATSTSFVGGNDTYSWGIDWTIIFIPVKSGVTYTVTNAGGPDGKRYIVMVDSYLKVTHGQANTETTITAVDGDVYLAVPYGATVVIDTSYEITTINEHITNLDDAISQIESDVTNLDDAISQIGDNLLNVIDISSAEIIKEGYFLNNGGYYVEHSNYNVAKITLDEGLYLFYDASFNAWASICLYDEADHLLYGINGQSIDSTLTVGLKLPIYISSNVSYILCSYINWYHLPKVAKLYTSNIQDIYSELDSINFITGNIKPRMNMLDYYNYFETKQAYINANSSWIGSSAYGWISVLIPIEPSKVYTFVDYNPTVGVYLGFLDIEKNIITDSLISVSSAIQFQTIQTVTAPDNAYFFVMQFDNTGEAITNSYFRGIQDFTIITDIETIKTKKDFSTISIPYIFGMVNSALYSREYVVRLFPESFLDSTPATPVTINYRRDAAFSRKRKTTTSFKSLTKTVLLQADGYNDKSLSFNFHILNESVFSGKNIRLCLFGVSFDSIDYRSDDGSYEAGGTMTMPLVEKYIRKSEADNSYSVNFVSIGTLGHSNGDTFTYNDSTLSSRGKHEARGGHCGVCYLRQPMNFSPSNIDYDSNVNGTTATGTIQWLMNGLKYRIPYNETYSTEGTDYGTFTRTTENCVALRCTPFGKYHHDYAEELWEFCNERNWINTVGGTYATYTGSDEQKSVIDLCMEYVAENPDYPFYDIDTARETSFSDGVIKSVDDNTQYSINYNKYLERYRTMDDSGTRLTTTNTNPAGESVTGSDGLSYNIGTKITSQTLLSNYDVCSPTHIIWDMMYNDWGYYVSDTGYSDGTDSLAMAELFITAIRSQLGDDVIIGLKAKRANGAFYPDIWSDVCLCQSYTATGSLLNYNKLLIDKYSDLTQNVSWIPTFAVSLPIATNFTQKFEDFLYDDVLVCSGDEYSSTSDVTHDGLRSAKAMAYQIYGWLAYTIKDL